MYPLKIDLNGCENLHELNDFIISNRIKLILFGETHGMIDELPIQKELIRNVHLEFYLYELLEEEKILSEEDSKIFLEKEDNENFSVISKFGELKPVVKLARKFNLPLIGCDIKNMLRKDKSFLEKTNLTDEEIKKEEEIIEKREIRQKTVVEEYLSKSDKIIFVSLGLYHIRKDSFLIQNLKENFLIIYPITKNGEKLWEAEEPNMNEISYIITSRDKYFNN